MNRDHSVVFEIASKYCISDCFIDHDGYSISSEGYLKFLARQLRPARFERTAVTGKLSAAERNYPTSEVGAEAWRTPCWKGDGREEPPAPEARGGGREEQSHV